MTSITLNTHKFILTSVGVVAIVAGMLALESGTELGLSYLTNKTSFRLGSLLLTIGWLFVPLAISTGNTSNLSMWLAWIGGMLVPLAAAILYARQASFQALHKPGDIWSNQTLWSVTLAVGWALVAFSIILADPHLGIQKALVLLTVTAAILAAVLWVLPIQTDHGLVNGPGWPLLMSGWFMIILAISSQ